jgi:formamidopyrimidine-DNA glycosylase
MSKLTKYIYGKDVAVTQRVQVIGKSIEKFNDNIIKSVYKGDEVPTFTDKQIENEITQERKVKINIPNSIAEDLKNQDLTRYQREAKVVNDNTVETMTKISSGGKLQGVRKIRDYVKDDGKTYVAVYVWSDKDIETINYIKQRMLAK